MLLRACGDAEPSPGFPGCRASAESHSGAGAGAKSWRSEAPRAEPRAEQGEVLADWFPLKFDKRFGGETEEAITGRIFVEVCAHPCVGPGFRCSSKHAFSLSLRPQDAGTGRAGAPTVGITVRGVPLVVNGLGVGRSSTKGRLRRLRQRRQR